MEVKFTLKNLHWEKGFQRLWLVYVFIFICGTIFSKYEEYPYGISSNWLAPLIDIIDTWDPEFWFWLALWLFVPVLLSKAIQWVLKGFKADNK